MGLHILTPPPGEDKAEIYNTLFRLLVFVVLQKRSF